MSEETNIELQSAIVQESNLVNPFVEESWVDTSEKADEQSVEKQWSAPLPTQDTQEEIYDANEYLKEKLGFDNWEEAANQIAEMRQNPKVDFENENSRKFYEYAKENKEEELIQFLQEKRKIDKLADGEIKDANTAAEIVKLSMYQKNKDLDDSEIDFLFNERFQKPIKPEQRFDEMDSEFEQRVGAWESRVNEIEKKLVIEAKLAKPDLEKYRSSLVLPDINQNSFTEQLSPEVLEAQKKYMDNYYQNANDAINSFDSFTATVKDEGADFSVAYVPSYEEKQIVAAQMKEFADNNLDANMIFAERWVNDDNTINVKQMAKDLLLIQNEGKITQKYVNEAANRRLAMHLKKQSNINISGQQQQGTFAPEGYQSEMDKLAAVMFAK
jgi:hypothetical protein